jgi:hypothetical protein
MVSGKEQEQGLDQDWLAYELRGVSLGDKRLDWRLIDTGSKLAKQASGTINQACEDWADTKASYRLFANPKTTYEKIQAPHQQRTAQRAQKYEQVLAIQDTTFLDYSHHPEKEGMGPIGTSKQTLTGLVMHTTLLTSTEGLPLGLASQEIWVRPERVKQMKPEQRRKLPIEEKESYKWLKALSQTVEVVPEGTQVISIGDSEADIFELFNHARDLETDLLIRAAQDRCVCEPEVGHLWHTLEQQRVVGHLKVQVPARKEEPKREAIVSVRYAKVTLKAPKHLSNIMADIPLYAILVQEEAPPDGVADPLCWLLLTTLPVHSLADALLFIQWYRQRWHIEVYFKVLKSGCQVEKSQLAKAERLIPFISLFTIIAWRLFWLTHISRHQPDAPCTLVLADHEWKALYAFHHKSLLLPDQPPCVSQALLWVAQLGGFLARKADGQPGVTLIWRGWQRLADISAAYLIFHPP